MPPNSLARPRRRLTSWAGLLPHLVFLVAALGTVVRLVELNSVLCWSVALTTTLTGLLYAVGSARWDRLGAVGRPIWLAVLSALWTGVAWAVPAPLAAGYAWLSVPLAVLALRMPGRWTRITALCVIATLQVSALIRGSGGGAADPELLAAPLAALAATVVLHRTQLRPTPEAARRQREAGRDAERARIARELHDSLAQELGGSIILLQAAERDWDQSPDAARQHVKAVVTALDVHLAETRDLIKDLIPPALERDGLETALRDMCAHTARTLIGPRAPGLTFRREHEPFPLSMDRALVLLQVARGLLANACEHARAAHIQVILGYGDAGPDGMDATVTVTVRDDGRGIPSGAPGPTDSGRGHGLAAAVERLRPLGGVLTLHSAPGRGTCAEATLPVRETAPAGPR
ncbi:sensor histidine kinase [Streptomyces sp. NPDC057301]|uniref:sensor histidine kinase n=1 Tax=Streptomyces sp. NPDC057301 TaxID=3346093 RepID=UPI0036414234